MKVRELQQHLGKLDPELEVLCYSEDENLLAEGQLFRLLGIESITTVDGEQVRLDDGTPYLTVGKSPSSVVLAILEVTTTF